MVVQLSFQTVWMPVPFNPAGPSWEPVFHAVLAGNAVYVPGGSGTVYKLDKATGAVLTHFNPLSGESNIFACGPLSADSAGNVYYNAIKLNMTNPWGKDAINSWL